MISNLMSASMARKTPANHMNQLLNVQVNSVIEQQLQRSTSYIEFSRQKNLSQVENPSNEYDCRRATGPIVSLLLVITRNALLLFYYFATNNFVEFSGLI